MTDPGFRDRLKRLTPEQREALASRIQESGLARVEHGIPLRPADEPAVLSFAQQRLWLLHQLSPDTAAYNVPLAVRHHGPGQRRRQCDGDPASNRGVPVLHRDAGEVEAGC